MVDNTKQWQDISDGWVKAMTESKENKELYQKYISKTDNPIPYREWLKQRKNNS